MTAPLPTLDRTLLQLAMRVVPAADRADWLRAWHAELWHRHHPRSGAWHSAADLYPGLLRDALWLRAESWRRAYAGTALLCLVTLATLTLFAALPLSPLFSDRHAAFIFFVDQAPRLLVEAALVTFVGFAFSPRPVEHRAHTRRLRAQLFQTAKLTLLELIAWLLTLDLTQPIHAAHPFTAEILQPQLFVVLTLLALRWSFHDQDTRCRHCLRSLAAASRVGRPSWNFLDSNGTHAACPDGHGLLSVPEIETSWRQSSEWIAA